MAILICGLWLYCLGFLKLIKRNIHSYFYIIRFYINKSLYKFKTDYLYRDGFKSILLYFFKLVLNIFLGFQNRKIMYDPIC